jgi:hypothetical protein
MIILEPIPKLSIHHPDTIDITAPTTATVTIASKVIIASYLVISCGCLVYICCKKLYIMNNISLLLDNNSKTVK